jgi:hypothetical protein
MMTRNHVLHGHRAVTVGVLGVAALLAVGVWGVINLVERDWFIGGVFVACALLGVPSLISTVRRMRRQERRSSTPASRRPG